MLLKLKPELIVGKTDEDYVGEMNIPVIMWKFQYKEIQRFHDPVRGEMVECSPVVTNGIYVNGKFATVKYEGTIRLLAKYLIPA